MGEHEVRGRMLCVLGIAPTTGTFQQVCVCVCVGVMSGIFFERVCEQQSLKSEWSDCLL